MSHELRQGIEEMRRWVADGASDPSARDEADRRFRARYREVMAEAPPAGSRLAEELRGALVAVAGDDDWPRALGHLERALRVVQGGWA